VQKKGERAARVLPLKGSFNFRPSFGQRRRSFAMQLRSEAHLGDVENGEENNDIADNELIDFLVEHHQSTAGRRDPTSHAWQHWRFPPDHHHPHHHAHSRHEPYPTYRRRLPLTRAALIERWEPGEIVEEQHLRPLSSAESVISQDHHQESLSPTSSTTTTSATGLTVIMPKKRGPRPKILTEDEKRQKRLDANDRERERMGKLNTAFDSLRHLLPKHGNDRELSKFETIQIAKNYIRALNEMLSETDPYFDGDGNASPRQVQQQQHSQQQSPSSPGYYVEQ